MKYFYAKSNGTEASDWQALQCDEVLASRGPFENKEDAEYSLDMNSGVDSDWAEYVTLEEYQD